MWYSLRLRGPLSMGNSLNLNRAWFQLVHFVSYLNLLTPEFFPSFLLRALTSWMAEMTWCGEQPWFRTKSRLCPGGIQIFVLVALWLSVLSCLRILLTENISLYTSPDTMLASSGPQPLDNEVPRHRPKCVQTRPFKPSQQILTHYGRHLKIRCIFLKDIFFVETV